MGKDFNGYQVKIFKTQTPDRFFENELNEFLKTCGTFQMFTNVLGDLFIVMVVY